MRIREDEKQEIYGKSRQLRIFDVAEFSVHDGPGVRVIVYFQGCNARCDWCHSPHSQPYCAPLFTILIFVSDAGVVNSFVRIRFTVLTRENMKWTGRHVRNVESV